MGRFALVFCFGLAVMAFVCGCGGGAQKGKNQDFDRPKAAATK